MIDPVDGRPNEFTCENGHYKVENEKLWLMRPGMGGKGYWFEVQDFLRVANHLGPHFCPKCKLPYPDSTRHDRVVHVYFCTGREAQYGFSEQGMGYFIYSAPAELHA